MGNRTGWALADGSHADAPGRGVDATANAIDAAWKEWIAKATELLRNFTIRGRVAEDHVLFDDGHLVINGNTNASHGYLYVTAWLRNEGI